MKITVDKQSITLSQLEKAKAFAKSEREWIDAETIEICARTILEYHYLNGAVCIDGIIKLPELSVTVNHYALTIWAHNCYVEYWHKSKKYIACLSFDLLQAVSGQVDCFMQTYERDELRTIED